MKYAQNKTEMLQSLLDRKQPRAFNKLNLSCTYDHSVNGGCAIGCQINKKLSKELDVQALVSVFECLPKRMQKMGLTFLKRIQLIHDLETNYNEDGIGWNEEGLKKIKKLAKENGIDLDYSRYE